MKLLVTGGAGYIGSHTCVVLLEAWHTADLALVHQKLGCAAENSIHTMCADTWHWQSTNPNGFSLLEPLKAATLQ